MSNNRQFNVLNLIDNFTEKIEDVIMSIGLYSISIIVFINVILRYFFSSSLTWAEELSGYILVWISFLGLSSCARYGAHVNMDVLPGLLKGKWKKLNTFLIDIITLAVGLFMTYVSIKFTRTQFLAGNVSISIAFPSWLIYLSTSIGFVFFDFIYIRKLVSNFTNSEPEEEEGSEK